MSELKPGDKVRVTFPVDRRGAVSACLRHMEDAVNVNGQVGEVFTIAKGEGHTVAVGFLSIWHEGNPWSDFFRPDELKPA